MKSKSGIMCINASKSIISSSNSMAYFVGQQYLIFAPKVGKHNRRFSRLIDRYPSDSLWRNSGTSYCQLRFYSSEINEKNILDVANNSGECEKNTIDSDLQAQLDELKTRLGELKDRLGELKDRTEELEPKKPLVDNENNKKKSSPLLTLGAKFRDDFLRKVVPWEEINDSWDTFPYYIHEHDKNLLMECMASRLKHKKCTRDYGGRLASSSGTILLQSIPGTELYRERLVRALAKDLQVPVLVLESSVLPPYEISQTALTAGNSESDEETSDDEETSGSEEDDITSGEESTDCSDDECKSCLSTAKSSEKAVCRLKEGDRVKYVGPNTSIKLNKNRILSSGQRGEVHEVNGNKVAIIFFISGLETKEAERDEKSPEPPIHWFDVKHIEHDNDAQMYDCYVAMEVLCQVLESQQPIVVYFSGSFWWLLRAVSKVTREEFFDKVEEMFDHLSGRMILIYGHNKWEAGLPCSLERLIKGLKATYRYEENEIRRLFTNVVYIKPPKEEDLLKTFCKKIEEDKSALISRSNFREMHKILKEHGLLCMDLEHVNTDGVILNKQKAEKIVGWATNHYLSSCHLPSVKENRLHVPHARLKEQEVESKNPSQRLKDLARNKYQRSFISAVVHPGEIGVKFDDVGALEDVKKALNELAILPMKRPELFSHGNLLRPCKGILLFGPPGTGKTLLAKALATEAGANFLNITPSSIASKWLGVEEKLTRALFSFAGKLAPVIIFLDEVDALLSARGGYTEHDSARKVRNEFMAAWDGLRSKDSQRILILGATNRPFDLDDAVIRRMPRRIYVGLPDVENRLKILKILLAKENLESGFYFEQLAMDTEGYSGSDLKNLCVAAAYRPLQELLEKESKGDRRDGVPALRPLKLDDFINSKVKVGPSVAYNSASLIELREWNEQYGGGSRRKSPFGF